MRVVGRLSVSWGRCVFSLLRAQSAGDRREVPRKYESAEFLFVLQTPAPKVRVRFSTAPCEARRVFCSLVISREQESEEA